MITKKEGRIPIFIIIIFLSIFILFNIIGMPMTMTFPRRCVPVTAEITKISKELDSDDYNDYYYKIFVSYQYDGAEFENKYWKRTNSNQYMEGDTVEVKIDSEHLVYVLWGWEYYTKFDMVIFTMAICFLAFDIMNFKKKSTDGRVMIDDMKVCNNLMTKLFYPMVFLLSFGSAMITETLFWDEPMNNSIGIASGALGVICLIYVIIDIKSLPKRPYYVSLQTCVNVTEEEHKDGDGDTTIEFYSDFTDVKHVKCYAKQGADYYIIQDHNEEVKKCYDSNFWKFNIEDKSLNKGSKALMLRMIITLLLCVCISVLFIILINFGV